MKATRELLPEPPLMRFSLCALSFSGGFFVYLLIEKLYKSLISHSPTHWSMGLVAGLACLFVLLLDLFSLPELLISLLGSVFITLCELFFGWLYNLRLALRIWDYSDMPVNFKGQICLPFSLIWTLASFGILLFNRRLASFLKRHSSIKEKQND